MYACPKGRFFSIAWYCVMFLMHDTQNINCSDTIATFRNHFIGHEKYDISYFNLSQLK